MDSDILFEKKYSQFIQDCCNSALKSDEADQSEDSVNNNMNDYVRKLITESVCVIMPGRIEGRDYFINLTKEIAEAYLIDVVIRERKDRITVTYSLDCDAGFSCLKPLIQLSDDFSFRNGTDSILISLDYQTHATYYSGRKVFP